MLYMYKGNIAVYGPGDAEEKSLKTIPGHSCRWTFGQPRYDPLYMNIARYGGKPRAKLRVASK